MTNIFTVAAGDLDRLDSTQAVGLIAHLLWAEAMRIGLPVSHVHIIQKVNVKDGGIDARIDPHDAVDFNTTFLPAGRTGLQIKAGQSFKPTPKQIRDELIGEAEPSRDALGSSARACLDENGTYILVCTGADPADEGRTNALSMLESLFKQCGYGNRPGQPTGLRSHGSNGEQAAAEVVDELLPAQAVTLWLANRTETDSQPSSRGR